jgi:hypothetical protein
VTVGFPSIIGPTPLPTPGANTSEIHQSFPMTTEQGKLRIFNSALTTDHFLGQASMPPVHHLPKSQARINSPRFQHHLPLPLISIGLRVWEAQARLRTQNICHLRRKDAPDTHLRVLHAANPLLSESLSIATDQQPLRQHGAHALVCHGF